MNCRDIHCENTKHIEDIDNYAFSIMKSMDESIKMIALKNVKKSKIIPGWNDLVKPYKEEAIFWHAIWSSAGKPINNTLHNIMKRTRNIYHYHIRNCRRSADMVRKNKLMDACLNGNGDVFEEIRKMRKVKKSLPHTMDGQTNVTERFKNVYQKLYNSVNDEQEVLKLVNNYVDVSSLDDVDLVNQSVVRKAVNNIKLHNNDPIFTFNSSCIKRAPSSLFQHLSLMMKCFLIHGHVSQVLLLATMVPLIKNKLDDSETSDNYRSIALSSVILKIFDWIVLLLFGENLGFDDLQFSYQQNCSTTMCTWLMVESTNYFLRNGSNVYSCFMDMRKAFDTVQHSKLFQKLNQRNLSSIFTRLVIVMYVSQSANVRWGEEVSKSFRITNGVKQGAVLSAILFCVYIDELITKLRRNKT